MQKTLCLTAWPALSTMLVLKTNISHWWRTFHQSLTIWKNCQKKPVSDVHIFHRPDHTSKGATSTHQSWLVSASHFQSLLRKSAVGAKTKGMAFGSHINSQNSQLPLGGCYSPLSQWTWKFQRWALQMQSMAYLCWKMISLGIEGQIKVEDQVKVLHIYFYEMDACVNHKTELDGPIWKLAEWRSQIPIQYLHEVGSRNGIGSQYKRAQECRQTLCMSKHMEYVKLIWV